MKSLEEIDKEYKQREAFLKRTRKFIDKTNKELENTKVTKKPEKSEDREETR